MCWGTFPIVRLETVDGLPLPPLKSSEIGSPIDRPQNHLVYSRPIEGFGEAYGK
jgi:hypothetical protein